MSYLMDTVIPNPNIKVVDANRQYLYTESHEHFIDWFMDSGTTSLGYKPRRLTREIAKYSFPHLPNIVTYPEREHVAKWLCELINGMDKVFFCNSGTEAIEAAIKIVRKWNYDGGRKRRTIWTVKGGFHGRTLGSLAAGDGALCHYEGFWPLPGGFDHFTNPEEIVVEDAVAIMFAPIFGSNDVVEYSKEWMDHIFDISNKYDIPIIFDEIQTGSFRTGAFTAAELYGVMPDIICLGKGIACGIPTGVTLANKRLSGVFTPGTHFSTFGGSPLSVIGILTLLKAEGGALEYLTKNVLDRSTQIINGLWHLKRYGVKDVRGRGLMLAIEFEEGFNSETYSNELFKQQMFIPTFRKNIMKLAPPLNITEQEACEGLVKLKTAFSEAYALELEKL